MAPRKKPKASEPRQEDTFHAEWFPVYGVRIAELPHVYLTGKTPGEAMTRLATLMADEGSKHSKDYRTEFLNEPFEIE